jgi:hypothetical protein
MEIRNRLLGSSGRADRGDGLPFGDADAAAHRDRPEVDERHGVAVGRLDREAETVRRHRTGE